MLGQALNTGDLLNRSHPLARGLAAFWLGLPGLQGSRLFDYCGGYHGTLTNGPTWASGPSGFGAVSLDGADDYVDCGATGWGFLTGDCSLAAAVEITGGGGTYRLVMGKGDAAGDSREMKLYIADSGRLAVVRGSGYAEGTTSLSVGSRYTVGASLTGTTVSFFLDGRADGSGTVGTPTAGSTSFVFGKDPASAAQYFNGRLQAAVAVARPWAANDHAALYDQFRRGFPDLLRRQTRRSVAFTGTSPPPPPSYFLPAVAGLGW